MKNIEINLQDIQKAYDILANETHPQKEAYYWGWAHCLNVLHKQGYFSEENMRVFGTPEWLVRKDSSDSVCVKERE